MTTGCISVFLNDIKQSMIFRGIRKIAKIDCCLTVSPPIRPSVYLKKSAPVGRILIKLDV
jgi:hypothetical protein